MVGSFPLTNSSAAWRHSARPSFLGKTSKGLRARREDLCFHENFPPHQSRMALNADPNLLRQPASIQKGNGAELFLQQQAVDSQRVGVILVDAFGDAGDLLVEKIIC